MLTNSGRSQGSEGRGKVVLTCSCGCGTEFARSRSALNASGLHYVSVQHASDHRTRMYLEEMCGPFLPLVTEYLDGFATQHYKRVRAMRSSVCPFLLFLTEKGVSNLEQVSPQTVTAYLTWAGEVEYLSARHEISVLTGFFRWAIRHGHRTSACPVVPKFHGEKRPHYLPRPYSTEEMALIWRLADERGSAMLRAALSIGQDSGLRLGEICNLRVEDVDTDGLWLFVRLPNKTNTERRAKFTDRAALHISEWLRQRDANCDHDHLFYNKLGDPMSPQTLHAAFCRTFCKQFGGRTVNAEGLEEWSTHRLRHTMASNLALGGANVTTIMQAGGWKSVSSMLLYTQPNAERARRGYDEAMARAYDRGGTQPTREIISPDAFLAEFGKDPEH